MSKASHTGDVSHPGDKIHIPLKEDEAVKALLQVRPTKDMPRPGATGKKAAQTGVRKKGQSKQKGAN